MEGVNMEELTIETSDQEPAGYDIGVLPEDADPDTEAGLPESEDDPDEGDYEAEPDENDVEEAESFENGASDADRDSESDTSPSEEAGSSEDISTYTAYDSNGTDSLLLVETMERQNDILCAGFMSTLFILGIILGVLIIHGFRLRRV